MLFQDRTRSREDGVVRLCVFAVTDAALIVPSISERFCARTCLGSSYH